MCDMSKYGTDSPTRRSGDTQQEKIDKLIEEEPDSKTRVMLMVMSDISKAIVANTDLTHAIHNEVKTLKGDLETHVIDITAAQNQSKGAAKIIRIASPLLWSIMAATIGVLYHSYDNFQSSTNNSLNTISVELSAISTRIDDRRSWRVNTLPAEKDKVASYNKKH